MQAFVKYGVRGVFEHGCVAVGGAVDVNELRGYILSKLLWNPDCDVKKHMEEFTDYYYGAAGVYVREYIETLCTIAEVNNIHVGYDDNPVSELFREDRLDLYESILRKAEEG